MNTTRPSNREAILAAAVRVIVRDGLLSLTLEGVAREAGLSKGGLLYHFDSKDALITGMLEHYLLEMEKEIARRQQADPEPLGSWLRAYLDCSLPECAPEGLNPAQTRQLHVALLAAIAINPRLIEPIKDLFDRWSQQQAQSRLSIEDLVTWLAVDGLWLWDIFGFLGAESEIRERLIHRLRERTR